MNLILKIQDGKYKVYEQQAYTGERVAHFEGFLVPANPTKGAGAIEIKTERGFKIAEKARLQSTCHPFIHTTNAGPGIKYAIEKLIATASDMTPNELS